LTLLAVIFGGRVLAYGDLDEELLGDLLRLADGELAQRPDSVFHRLAADAVPQNPGLCAGRVLRAWRVDDERQAGNVALRDLLPLVGCLELSCCQIG